jgi:ketosteroid isomerase-like protein
MPAQTPADTHRLWSEYFKAADLDELMTLYEPDAVLVPEPGQAISGHKSIRDALQGFLSLNGRFDLQVGKVLEAGDIAVLYSRWTLEGTGADGREVSLTGLTNDVVRLQDDGTWLLVVDNPFGSEGMESER